MSKTKKLDIFNLFYSGAAVVILIGVIAKLLEWPLQDLLITGGLAIEALVFAVSAIKFVDVKQKVEGATEATLTKVADGLGSLTAGATIAVAGVGAGSVTGTGKASGSHVGPATFGADFNTPTYTDSSWKLLEQMDVLTLTKDMFYHPSWVNLKSEEYTQLTELFKTLFNKKLPSKDALPFLIKFPVAFPISDIDGLVLTASHTITTTEVEVLYKALRTAEATYLFDKAVIEETGKGIVIRPRKENEIQIFGGEAAAVLAHAQKFHAVHLIVSPVHYFLQETIGFKEETLTQYFIDHANITDEAQVVSLADILVSKSDTLKNQLWDKLDTVTYDAKTGAGYGLLKALVASAVSFQNKADGSALILDKVIIKTEKAGSITRLDVVNCSSETVYFGKDNEYNVKLAELFTNGELQNKGHFDTLIAKLSEDKVASAAELQHVFDLTTEDTVADLLSTLNHHLAKTNSAATGAQLSFVLLCKVFINS
jgi:hypothetical protein